ncbi:hypothetical protein G6F31_010051 [Rhizopus arrhizus]|nr:hypothetical protein G6F31_010051 [Rhizopus arrhizus]
MTSTAQLTSPSSADLIDRDYTLDHKYTRNEGRIYLSGVQALVRLPLMQRLRDAAEGIDSAGFVSGYRGSPLGGFDLELWRARKHLNAARVKFTHGLNEDLGATMVWGTQQTNLFPGANVQGVFGMWYGKGPGVDRAGDALHHGNAAGASRNGGVLRSVADRLADAHRASHVHRRVRDLRAVGLGAVALFRHLGRVQGRVRDHRKRPFVHACRRARLRHARRSGHAA